MLMTKRTKITVSFFRAALALAAKASHSGWFWWSGFMSDGSGGAEVADGVGGVPAPRDVQGPGEFPQLLTGEGEAGGDLAFTAEDDHGGREVERGLGEGCAQQPGRVRLAPAES